ncbi:MAG TPA: hypothetical protein VJY42_00135 [Candidatus Methanomethylophilaceae archaeon]|nr:hypothetical protein [Candidatus Methanomethylophilaceae archaeon]
MINKKSILAIVLIAMIAVPLISIYGADDADAATADNCLSMDVSTFSSGGFDSRTAGNVSITIRNSTAVDATVDVYVTYQYSENVIGSVKGIIVPVGGLKEVDLNFMIDSQGTKNLTLWAESQTPGAQFFISESRDKVSYNFSINVKQSIWSNWGTYVAIILVVAIVGIAIFIKYRNVPKAEQTTTFTELDDLKRSRRSQSTSSKAPTVERKRYDNSKRKK